MGTLWRDFLKFFDGLCPTIFNGESSDFKNLYFSKWDPLDIKRNNFVEEALSASEIVDLSPFL